jgi:hypothetical protein
MPMPPRSLLRAFVVLWLITGAVLLIASLATVREASAGSGHANPHLIALSGLEAAAAVLFMIPRTFRSGAIGLLITIGVAFIAHIALGQFRGDLLIYGAVVSFLLVHGPLTPLQWRAAISRPAV